MIIPKAYLHDRRLLVMGSVDALLAMLLVLSSLLRVDGSHSSFIVQYRANIAIDAYKSGPASELYSFAAFAVLVLALHLLVSFRLYRIHRQLAVVVLALGALLLVLALIVSNALLVLR